MDKKKALITGITGQIGSYLAEILKEKGYEVYGIIRRKLDQKEKLYLESGLIIIEGDLEDPSSIERAIKKVQPDEIYNLAAQSDAQISSRIPEYTLKINGLSLFRICDIASKLKKQVKIFQAASAELYGGLYNGKVNENTPFHPQNPYSIAKLSAYWITRYYRDKNNLFICNGILFNVESPRRGINFVTKKIVKNISDITKGKLDKLSLGNLNAKRDWSHAKDSALAMWKILQADKPDDYVIASGECHSVREFVELAFKYVGIEIAWKGSGIDEVGYDKKT